MRDSYLLLIIGLLVMTGIALVTGNWLAMILFLAALAVTFYSAHTP